jgi:hypothetical protein
MIWGWLGVRPVSRPNPDAGHPVHAPFSVRFVTPGVDVIPDE